MQQSKFNIDDLSQFTASSIKEDPEMKIRTLMMKAVEFLCQNREIYTRTALFSQLGPDCTQKSIASRLWEEITQNAKITSNEKYQTVSYKPTIQGLRNKEDLLQYIFDSTFQAKPLPSTAYRKKDNYSFSLKPVEDCIGVLENDLNDAYANVQKDIEQLIKENVIFRFPNPNPKCSPVLFFQEKRSSWQPAEKEVQELWDNLKMPQTKADLEHSLVEQGHSLVPKVSLSTSSKEKEAPVKKQGVKRKPRFQQKLTNVHLLEDLEFLRD